MDVTGPSLGATFRGPARRRQGTLIVDIRLPPTFTDEGLVAAERLKAEHQQLGVLVLSTYVETAYTLRLLAQDARGVGYLLKDRVDDPEGLLSVLERLVAGETVVDPEVVSRMLRPRVTATSIDALSAREREILDLVAQGRTNAAIAQSLFLSQKTVEAHIASVFHKLGLVTAPDSNRRVLAVLMYLRAVDGTAGPETRSLR